MSDEIREQEWKTIWESQEFPPSPKGWEKMAGALSGKEDTPAVLIPAWWSWRRYGKAMAAALVLGLGTWSVWQFNRQPAGQNAGTQIASVLQPAEGLPGAQKDMEESQAPTTPGRAASGHNDHTIAAVLPGNSAVYPMHQQEHTFREQETLITDTSAIATVQPKEIFREQQNEFPVEIIKPKQEAIAAHKETPSGFEPITNEPNSFGTKERLDKSMSIGLAANIGKPSLGNIQYNVGVVVRKEWNDAFYTEASVSMAATDIRFSENNRYGISYKNGDVVNAEGANSLTANTIGETQTTYGNNILGLGVAPMAGYKITKQVSLAVGVDLYRNLNTGLNLYYNSDIAERDIKDMAMVKRVSQWDSGVKGQLGIKVNKALSVLAQYRHGLTNYISTEQRTYKSSLFNIGLMYRFQP